MAKNNMFAPSTAENPLSTMLEDHAWFRKVLNPTGQMVGLLSAAQLLEASQLKTEFLTRISMHEALEEQVIHPAFPFVLANRGEAILKSLTDDDIASKKLADKVESADPTKDLTQFQGLWNELAAAVLQHAEREENEYWPELVNAMTVPQRQQLASDIDSVRASGLLPTHAHPWGPSTPYAARLMQPFAGALDKVRDAAMGTTNRASDARVNLNK